MKVALGAAKGLAYLHSDEARVIYRDFKTSNILLDSVRSNMSQLINLISFRYSFVRLTDPFYIQSQNHNAKLSDFGLAKDGPEGDRSHVSTRVMGTFGYAAPEYMATGIFSLQHIYEKHDLYIIEKRILQNHAVHLDVCF